MAFVCVRTTDFQPRFFMRVGSGVSSLCTNDCVFNHEEHQKALNRLIASPWSRNDWQFYKIPDNYSVIGKTPLEFMIETQGYKPPEKSGLCAKQKRRFQNAPPKKRTAENKQKDLFSDLGENRQLSHSEMETEIAEYDLF